MKSKKVIGVDIGATNLRVGYFVNGKMIEKKETRTPRKGPVDVVAKKIVSLIHQLVKDMDFDGIGIGSIGPLDLDRGWVVNTPNNPLSSFPIVPVLSEEFEVDIILQNDCVAAVWGEKVFGKGKELSDIAYITISSGIGGGFVVDGKLLTGWRGNAHEIGHIVLDHNSNISCGCGGKGHWEGLASGANLHKTAYHLAMSWRGEKTRAWEMSRNKILPETLLQLYRLGDEFAVHVVDYLIDIHSAGIASIIATFDPQMIFLGGSLFLRNKDVLLSGIKKRVIKYSLFPPPPIQPGSFGDDEVLYGAAALIYEPPS